MLFKIAQSRVRLKKKTMHIFKWKKKHGKLLLLGSLSQNTNINTISTIWLRKWNKHFNILLQEDRDKFK